jgi:hypothetical protein
MSGSAHGGNHDVAFYEAAIEETYVATATVGSLVEFNSDAAGALLPGRYLVQVVGLAAGLPAQVAWVHVGKFVSGTALSPLNPVAAGTKRFPLTATIPAVEFHVLGGYSDRAAVQIGTGSDVTCFLSRVSTEVRKSNRRA